MTRNLHYNALRSYTLADALSASQKQQVPVYNPLLTNVLVEALRGIPTQPTNTLYNPLLPLPTAPHNPLMADGALVFWSELQKRRAYFAFYYNDIMRVNNVRNAWKIRHPNASQRRSFYDSSLWESRKLEGDDAIKRLIREGVVHTSAVCVLIGTETWWRPWVRYEIARAVIDGRGLLGVHINGINHHTRQMTDAFGPNPLDNMAVGKVQDHLGIPQYYLFEYRGGWIRYQDYTLPVKLPPYLSDPTSGYVMPLSIGTYLYDFAGGNGHANIGAWIDHAAKQVGR
jgi:hypothetical protein